jgi:hypothetical protein
MQMQQPNMAMFIRERCMLYEDREMIQISKGDGPVSNFIPTKNEDSNRGLEPH